MAKIKVRQFNITFIRERKAYEKILNEARCEIQKTKEFQNRDGDVIVYIEWEDLRNEDDD